MPKATVKKTSINLKFTTSKARKDKVVLGKEDIKIIIKKEYTCKWKTSTCRRIGTKYNVSYKSIYRIFKRCDEFKGNNNDIFMEYQWKYFKERYAKVPILEMMLKKYLEQMRGQKKKVSFEKLTSMGYKCRRELIKKMENDNDFKNSIEKKDKNAYSKLKRHAVSRGYLQKFLARCAGNFGKSKRLFGQAGEVNDDDDERMKILNIIKNEIKDVHPSFIWNMDESGIRYQKLPDRTYLAKFERNDKVRGTSDGNDKARLSFITCVNGIGKLIK